MQEEMGVTSLLPCHDQAQPFLRCDLLVKVIHALVELDPVDRAVELARLCGVIF